MLFYVFPQYLPVVGDIANMNWAIAIVGVVVLVAAVTWIAKARKHYMVEGPPILEGEVVVPGALHSQVTMSY